MLKMLGYKRVVIPNSSDGLSFISADNKEREEDWKYTSTIGVQQ